MVDWKSPNAIARDGVAFLKLVHVLLGIYCWEFVISLGFDWKYLSGRRRMRWPLVFYFLNRYMMLFCLVGITVALDVTTEINCQVLYVFNQLMGNMTIGLVSINLSIRTMAVWGQKWYIVGPLIVIILGHWSILLRGVQVRAEWNPLAGCIITDTKPKIISTTFIYSMCFDFVVLCLTAIKLHTSSAAGRSKIGSLIFHDGLVYFIVAFLANMVAVVFLILDLNPVMSIIAALPAAVASTIVTCRAIRRLANFTSVGAEVYQGSSQNQSINASKGSPGPTISLGRTRPGPTGGVHIQMQSYERYDSSDDHQHQIPVQEFKSHLAI